jgi:hypothetical protein
LCPGSRRALLRAGTRPYAEPAATAAVQGVAITAQGLDQRLTEAASACLAVALPALMRFTSVFIQDSTTIGLPRTLARTWLGSDNQHTPDGAAALKLGVRLNLSDGRLDGPHLDRGVTADRRLRIQTRSSRPAAPMCSHITSTW